mmetsp:Transcript_15829/g.24656  ORF Transcript_15829/g.24656 Transcript_15829/m.24656 type:complete len:222 (-) Transcript_15829:44-709(-)
MCVIWYIPSTVLQQGQGQGRCNIVQMRCLTHDIIKKVSFVPVRSPAFAIVLILQPCPGERGAVEVILHDLSYTRSRHLPNNVSIIGDVIMQYIGYVIHVFLHTIAACDGLCGCPVWLSRVGVDVVLIHHAQKAKCVQQFMTDQTDVELDVPWCNVVRLAYGVVFGSVDRIEADVDVPDCGTVRGGVALTVASSCQCAASTTGAVGDCVQHEIGIWNSWMDW